MNGVHDVDIVVLFRERSHGSEYLTNRGTERFAAMRREEDESSITLDDRPEDIIVDRSVTFGYPLKGVDNGVARDEDVFRRGVLD
jgi:hypothetical protein